MRRLYLLAALILAAAAVSVAVRGISGRRPKAASPSLGAQRPDRSNLAAPRPPKLRLPLQPSAAELQRALAGANLVIVVLDAARADHVGCYGYPRDTTPQMDRLARESVLFEQHFCVYPGTTPSTTSLLTGLYPDAHGVFGALGPSQTEYQRLDPAILTLERALQGEGYLTLMLTANEAASPGVGVGEDFDEVWRHRQTGSGGMGAAGAGGRFDSARQLARRFRWMVGSHPGRRFFAYLHFLPPHSPYDAPEEIKALFLGKKPPSYFQTPPFFPEATRKYRAGPPPADRAEWVNLYDANLRWADRAVGEVRAALEETGLLEDTLLIVTADHGEALGEHGYVWHENVPYDEALHIPLLIRFPGGSPSRRLRALTQTVDLMPTILDLLGVSSSGHSLQGHSLVPLLTGGKKEVRQYAFAQTYGPYQCRVARTRQYALLQYDEGRRALYDVANDPRQTRNVIAAHPAAASSLARALHRFLQECPPRPAASAAGLGKRSARAPAASRRLSEDTVRELRSLGYLK